MLKSFSTRKWLLTMLLLVAAMVMPVTGNAQVKLTCLGAGGVMESPYSSAENLFDGSVGTKCWLDPYAYIAFKASQACRLKGYTITTGNDYASNPGSNPRDWKIYGSNDGEDWTELVSVSGDIILGEVDNTAYEYTLETGIATQYEYYMWEITANHGAELSQVSEFSITVSNCTDNAHEVELTLKNQRQVGCSEVGYTQDFYQCSSCGRCYSDAEGTNEIDLASVIIPAKGHQFDGENGDCSVCGLSHIFSHAGTGADPLQISTADDLYWFAAWVNGTYTLASSETVVKHPYACAVLMNDITVNTGVLNADGTLASDVSGFSVWKPIGNFDNQYKGIFNGQGHTVSGLCFNNPETRYVGLIGYLGSGGKISNVGVVDSYFYGDVSVGGMCGYNNSGNISNCYYTGAISGSGAYVGGVCGSGDGGEISNCYSAGTVRGSSHVGGVCGYNSGEISNCYHTGAVIGSSAHVGGVCGFNAGPIFNCYNTGAVRGDDTVGGVCGETYAYIGNCYSTGAVSGNNCIGGVCGYSSFSGTISNIYFDSEKCEKGAFGYFDQGTVTNVEGKTTAQFESGEVCYLLNEGKTNGTQIWYQDLTPETGDQSPIWKATGENTVYQVTKYSGCEHEPGTSVEHYSNLNKDVYAGYTSEGICSHGYQKAFFNSTDNAYEISNAGQLLWFAGLVNGTLTDGTTQNKAANAKVMCDIDFGTTQFAAIGKTSSILYAGTFDGNGHTIKVNQTGSSDVALFGNIGACTIKNLTVTGTINTSVKYAAGIAMHKYGDGTTATIENCISDVTIESTVSGDGTHGGIIAVVDYGTLNINHCAFTGAINGSETNKCGGFIGYTNKTSNISNSYVSATFGISSAGCNIVSRKGGTVTVTNCYYLNELGNYMDGITRMTAAQFANGEVCYLLNDGKTDGTQAWHQNLTAETGDKYPVLTATDGNTVYGADIECAGVIVGKVCANTPVTGEVYDTHDMDDNGFCSRGCFEATPYNETDGVYEISNAGQYNWFAGLVNGTQAGTTQNKTAKAVLKNDVDFGTHQFLSIGGHSTTNLFEGTFDGQGHSLTVNQSGSSHTTPFGYIGACTIENLTVKGVIHTDLSFTSGIAASKYGSGTAYIKKCISDVTIQSSIVGDGTHGGLLGTCEEGTINIQDCGFTGAMNGENTTCCGGFVGYTKTTSNISGSYISATFGIEDTDCNIVSRKGGTVSASGCYYVNQIGTTVPSGMTKVTQAQVESGELAYQLNGSKSDGTQKWYQDLTPETGDKHPVLTSNGNNTVYDAPQLCGGINHVGNTYANTETVSVEHVLGEEVSFNSEKAIYQKTCQREGCGTAIYFADSKGLYAAEEDAEGAFTTDTYVLQDATEYVNQAVCTATEFTYTRSFPGTNWAAWYVPFELTLTEEICSKYKFSRISNVHQYDTDHNGTADKTIVESFIQKPGVTLQANYPYLVKPVTEADREMSLTLTNVVAAKAEPNSIDCQSVDYKYTFTGTYSGLGDGGTDDNSPYALFSDGQWWHFRSLSPMRHYLTISSLTPIYLAAPALIVLQVTGEEGATGIVTPYDENRKQSETYDLSGRRLPEHNRHGLMIRDGKVIWKK